MDKLTYISLFSCAGVGCFGFKQNGFECIATNELLPRRMAVQKANHKCKYDSGYLCGDITTVEMRDKLFAEIDRWKANEGISDVTVVVATPPCQGMSCLNKKKNEGDLARNSLVVQAVELVSAIKPRYFVFENVPTFLTTACTDIDGQNKLISDKIQDTLGNTYNYVAQVLNFGEYGSNSSRKRTLVIGVRRDIADIVPESLFPIYKGTCTLRELIGDLPSLTEMGEISPADIYHNFKPYAEHMREWVHNTPEGLSAANNANPLHRPHKVVDGEVVFNNCSMQGKYRRCYWDKPALCVHTRSDVISSQSTIHPSDDRVFSVRELMRMQSVPPEFEWSETPYAVLNKLSFEEKRDYLKQNEMNIRQCLGEAVPTVIFASIAEKICDFEEDL